MAENNDQVEDAPAGQGDDFSQQAKRRQGGIVGEYLAYLGHSKKWWLSPIIVLLLLVGGVLVLGGTVAAPLLYALF